MAEDLVEERNFVAQSHLKNVAQYRMQRIKIRIKNHKTQIWDLMFIPYFNEYMINQIVKLKSTLVIAQSLQQ